ncbi:NADH dehydrogenase ubiquinone Fe-S protein 4 [Hansschlegelia sp.]|uniref:NADH dehydrogenase ubiquinone Fe-S protein 4 n=1 Tax=Hansschlegelia sp. TaxID=2041892 RepID=UPI002BF2C221|nr:NADH dehydrogenase ubiquinone Fe-S protein 4 [Hansschlegelia sp.]HVI27272.1 NADH dehydrogenase ubiquinone Fe-S protein 4 [Hansschlegelia sp.]
MTSARPRRGWRLAFERRSAPWIEPLMGWTGGDDTLAQVELEFPTLEAAVRYARGRGLDYVVQAPPRGAAEAEPGATGSAQAFSDATLERLRLRHLRESYGAAVGGAANWNEPVGPESWGSPMDVVRDPTLSAEAKRSILMNWAWTERLIDQATNEGMPENGRPSRLDEVEQALLTLEGRMERREEANPEIPRAA